MEHSIGPEEACFGERWAKMHGGYFSDPAVAESLLSKVRELIAQTDPDAIVDLGCGTGFLLSRILAGGIREGMRLINLDCSESQLAIAIRRGITCISQSLDSFLRRDLDLDGSRCLHIMRSVLHYFGRDGLTPVLEHIRTQMRPGEYFIHQTASFYDQRHADCLNAIYGMMRTDKWYPTVDSLRRSLQDSGFDVLDISPAPTLTLSSDDLSSRYGLSAADVERIRERISRDFTVPGSVFREEDDGFCAHLDYHIYTCAPG